jgi:predicted metal-binding protein
MAVCDRAVTVAFRGTPDRWAYIVGGLAATARAAARRSARSASASLPGGSRLPGAADG